MTPQERRMIEELFERLAALENAPRDAEAVDAINVGLERAPNALYPLVQSVLVQDEALKRADARIRELEDELGLTVEPPPQQPKSFLDGMRDTLVGKREPQGSVPSVRPGEPAPSAPAGAKWGSGTTLAGTQYAAREGGYPERNDAGQQGGYQQGGYGGPQGGYGAAAQAPGSAGGGSFLGTAATTAAAAVGGALLMNSMRGMFGGSQGQAKAQEGNRAFDQGGGGSPWNPGGGGGGGDLARQAGADDIGRSGSSRTAAAGSAEPKRQGAFDAAQNESADADDTDLSDDDDDAEFGDDESGSDDSDET